MPTRSGISGSWDFALLVCTALVAALYGNLGYLGMALDRIGASGRQAREAQRSQASLREVAEESLRALRSLLQEREQLQQMLVHEIRQTLHNASGALQAAAIALAALLHATSPAEADRVGRQVGERLQRAQGVSGDVRSVLDNTLAAASLLARHAPVVLQDTEIDFLIAMVLGDLTEAQRGRVQVRWQSSYRSADLEPGLVACLVFVQSVEDEIDLPARAG